MTAEKRKFTRQSASIAGTLVLSDQGEFDCVISDFSQGGMLVILTGAGQLGRLRESLKVNKRATVVYQLDGKNITVDVSVAHVSRQGIGLQLVQPDPRFVLNIQRAARLFAVEQSAPVMNIIAPRQQALDPLSKAQLIKKTNHHVTAFFNRSFPEFTGALKDALITEADRQRSQTAQQPFFDTLGIIRTQQMHLVPDLSAKISADAAEAADGRFIEAWQARKPRNERAGLSLVEKNEFEDWLVIRKAISKAEIILREQLLELQLRLDAAFGSPDGSHCYNPYSPSALCYGFAEVTRDWRLTGKVQVVAFKVLYDVLLSNLAPLYRGLNQLFIEAGVLPDIDVEQYLTEQAIRERKANDASRHQQPPPAPADITSPAPSTEKAQTPAQAESANTTPGSAKATPSAFNTATRLWSAHKRLNSGTAGRLTLPEEPSEPPLPSRATLSALQQMQQQLLAQHADLSKPGALKQLLEASDPGVQLSEFEEDSADMIENLFDNIVQSDQVADDLRDEVRKLEVPVLRVMLKDQSLFTADFHPARQAVNHIALLSDQSSTHAAYNKAAVINAITTILESSDDEGFTRSLLILDQLVAKEKRLVERNLRRLAEAADGQQRIRKAQQLIDRELVRRFGSRPVPAPVFELLEHGWKGLMMLCLFRQGDDSRSWDLTLAIVDQLVARTLPDSQEASGNLIRIDALLRLIGKGLAKVHDAEGRHEQLLDNIESLLNGNEFPSAVYRSTIEPVEEPSDNDATAQRWIKRAKGLRKGQWLECLAPPQSPVLYQLAWVADDFSQFILASQQGKKVSELSLQEMAHKLRHRSLTALEHAALPAVEQGLDTLVQKIYEKLAFEASHDQLTGLCTRREFSQCIAQSVANAKERRQRHTLIFIDILQFKLVNNTCGYEAGDRLLQELARSLENLAGDDAIVGRIGAAEFGVVVPLDAEVEGFQLASAIKAEIEGTRFEEGGHSFVINTAMALLGFDHTNDRVMELLRTVEVAAEMSKKAGRRKIQVVHPGDARLEERDEVMNWVTRINRALDENSLKIRCQAISPIHSSVLPHYEILLTVVDDAGNHLPPGEFITAAEEFNRMAAVDRWVIEAVFGWMTEHLPGLEYIGGFSINLSGHSLNDETFTDFLFDALIRYPVPRDKLIFEITETTAIANLEDASDFITEMRGIGCRFSLDDFGVGQSSFSYLKRLPVDFIKIDGSFVINIADDPVDFALVRSITEMGHFLGKKVIAEYVADAAILEAVSSIGVDYAQGFHFGRHVMLDQLVLAPPAANEIDA
ncbi:DUF1631 family protein [Pseudomonas sp. gcc21]|uniref:DUF1631 family protein n=1 Tax=Pseudomonas sp. gcc21 TaxID=2726989 RepID=UPI0014525DFA|nr:DUF1631 family protein [Pseudomonas sp. gcc21]QJD59227.1 DUF1631 family protein [Pseudomonas sp. gcc21]